MTSLLRPFLHDRFLHLLVVLGLLLACFVPFRLAELPGAVDWPTIITLSGLLMLTKGIEASGYFDVLGRRLVQGFRHQRQLALFLVAAAALLSTFLTNDVALFILVPLTLSLRKYSALPIARLIIFEALAVNAGSLLTPSVIRKISCCGATVRQALPVLSGRCYRWPDGWCSACCY
ncbi:hypothetical protein ERHA54_14750 [Erwinia rhapontici]|nr:hypothetical protein ERHA54_14750 [Erwinia rhapontici]